MSKKDLKTLISLIIIFVCMGILGYVISYNTRLSKKNLDSFIIVNGSNFWSYEDKKWNNLNDMDKFDWNKFKIYTNNNYINSYYITISNNKFYFFDSENESHHIEYPFLAINKDSVIQPIEYIEEKITTDDYNTIQEYLKNEKISYAGEYSKIIKYKTDINEDQKQDYIYIVSNELYSTNNLFYAVFAKCNNKYITISIQKNKDILNKYEIGWILSLKSNNYYNIILKKYIGDNYTYYLYEYNKYNKYKNITPK